MELEVIGHGAEAIITKDKNLVFKKRISKKYRLPILDAKIIKRRTKAERKLLTKASNLIPAPNPKQTKEKDTIIMNYIEGDKLSNNLDNYPKEKQEKIMKQIGKSIAKLHKNGIIHGDLTTSNMILKKSIVYFIDFGLGYFNGKYEDKGVDVHLLKQALEAKHFKNWEFLFEKFHEGYEEIDKKESEKVFNRLKKIEKRGRYKH